MYRMAQEQGLLWRCEYEDCGHRWVAASKEAPDKCGKCRRRGWHKTQTTAELVKQSGVGLEERMEVVARRVFEDMMAGLPVEPVDDGNVERSAIVLPDVAPAGNPDIAALRAICAGDLPTTPVVQTTTATAERRHCSYTEYDQETGETYRCGLPEHSQKVRHTRGPKV
jgi:hypothetical protein